MSSFLILCTLLSVCIFFFEKIKLSFFYRSIGILFFLCFYFIFIKFFISKEYLGADQWYNISPTREILLFLIMTAGMFASVLNEAIISRKKKIKQKSAKNPDKIKLSIDRWDVLRPFLFSYLTFAALLSNIENQNMSIVTTSLAFQTGFLWQTITKKS